MQMTIFYKNDSSTYVTNECKRNIIREYRWYDRTYGDNIAVMFEGNGLKCLKCGGVGGWAVAEYFDGAHKSKDYWRLGNALNRLENSDF